MYLTGYTIAIVPLTGACGGPQGMITIDNIPKVIILICYWLINDLGACEFMRD